MKEPVPSTAFADAWIQVDRTENPDFFVKLLDATRAELLERARLSPAAFFAHLDIRPEHRVLDAGCGTGTCCACLQISCPTEARWASISARPW